MVILERSTVFRTTYLQELVKYGTAFLWKEALNPEYIWLHWVHHVSPGSWWVPGSQFTSSSWCHPQHASRPVGSISNSKHSSAQRFSVSIYTSRTAQGGGGSFIDRGAIGQLSCWSVGDGVTGGWSVDVRLPNSVDLLGKFMYSSIFLFVPLFVYLPACHPCCLSIYLSLFLSIYLFIYLYLCLSIYLSNL